MHVLKLLILKQDYSQSPHLVELVAAASRIYPAMQRIIPFTLYLGPDWNGDVPISYDYILGVVLMVSGALVRKASYRYLGRHFTAVASLLLKRQESVTDGLY